MNDIGTQMYNGLKNVIALTIVVLTTLVVGSFIVALVIGFVTETSLSGILLSVWVTALVFCIVVAADWAFKHTFGK